MHAMTSMDSTNSFLRMIWSQPRSALSNNLSLSKSSMITTWKSQKFSNLKMTNLENSSRDIKRWLMSLMTRKDRLSPISLRSPSRPSSYKQGFKEKHRINWTWIKLINLCTNTVMLRKTSMKRPRAVSMEIWRAILQPPIWITEHTCRLRVGELQRIWTWEKQRPSLCICPQFWGRPGLWTQ